MRHGLSGAVALAWRGLAAVPGTIAGARLGSETDARRCLLKDKFMSLTMFVAYVCAVAHVCWHAALHPCRSLLADAFTHSPVVTRCDVFACSTTREPLGRREGVFYKGVPVQASGGTAVLLSSKYECYEAQCKARATFV